MPVPSLSAADYARAFLSLLPGGPAWPRDPDATAPQVAACLVPTYERNTARAAELLVDAFPTTAVELLPEWEWSLGLPDLCAGESPTLQQRQAQVAARLSDSGGASIPYLTAFAASLGYQVTISQFAPAVAGRLCAGEPAYGAAWAFAWQVNASSTTVVSFRAGASTAGEPLETFGNAVLECELTRIAPAYTIPLFAYGGAPAAPAATSAATE